MQREFAATSIQPHLLPRVTTINDLVTELTRTTVATDIEMMFALYDAYCQAMGDRAQSFDKFVYWAQLIISDFNDIDRSMADAGEIYRNLDSLNSLGSNYLTPEVQEAVERVFGPSLFTAFFDTSADADLWQRRSHGEQPEGSVKQEFMSLWNALHAIYVEYHRALEEKGVISPGRQLRWSSCLTASIRPERPTSGGIMRAFSSSSTRRRMTPEHCSSMAIASDLELRSCSLSMAAHPR